MKKIFLAAMVLSSMSLSYAAAPKTTSYGKLSTILNEYTGRQDYISNFSSYSIGALMDVSTRGASDGYVLTYHQWASSLTLVPAAQQGGGGGSGGSGVKSFIDSASGVSLSSMNMLSSQFTRTTQGSSATFVLNPASVTLQGNLVNITTTAAGLQNLFTQFNAFTSTAQALGISTANLFTQLTATSVADSNFWRSANSTMTALSISTTSLFNAINSSAVAFSNYQTAMNSTATALSLSTSTLQASINAFVNFGTTSNARVDNLYTWVPSSFALVNTATTSLYNNFNAFTSTTQGKLTELGASTNTLANRTPVIVMYQSGSRIGDASAIDISGSAIQSYSCSGTTCSLVLTAGSGGAGVAVAGVLFTGAATVTYSTLAVPGATITSGAGISSFTWTPQILSTYTWAAGQFTLAFSSINALGVSTQTILTLIANLYTAVNSTNTAWHVFADTAQVKDFNLSTATNTILNMISSNAVVVAGLNSSTQTLLVMASTAGARADAVSISTSNLAIAISLATSAVTSADIFGRTYYLHHETTGPFSTYLQIASTPDAGAEITKTQAVTAALGLVKISSFITLNNDPGTNKIPAGTWDFTMWAQVDSILSADNLIVSIATCDFDGSNPWEIVSATSSNFISLGVNRYDFTVIQNFDVFPSTAHRLIFTVSGRTASIGAVNFTLYFAGTSRASHFDSPLSQVYKFTQLSDVPQTYLGQGGKYLAVNNDQTALVFVSSNTDSIAGISASTNAYANFDNARASSGDQRMGTITSPDQWTFDGTNQVRFSTSVTLNPFGISPVTTGSGISTTTVLGSTNPYRSIPLPASSWYGCTPSSASAGNGGFVQSSTATTWDDSGDVYILFGAPITTPTFACNSFFIPMEMDASSISFSAVIFSTGLSGRTIDKQIGLSFQAVAVSSGGSVYSNMPSSVTVFATFAGTNTYIYTEQSAGFNMSGTPLPGTKVKVRLGCYGGGYTGLPAMTDVTVWLRQNKYDGKLR